jgi:hypothetical protein
MHPRDAGRFYRRTRLPGPGGTLIGASFHDPLPCPAPDRTPGVVVRTPEGPRQPQIHRATPRVAGPNPFPASRAHSSPLPRSGRHVPQAVLATAGPSRGGGRQTRSRRRTWSRMRLISCPPPASRTSAALSSTYGTHRGAKPAFEAVLRVLSGSGGHQPERRASGQRQRGLHPQGLGPGLERRALLAGSR